MRNRFFLISLICVIFFSPQSLGENQDFYAQAKVAYRNNDCESTIRLLRKYLSISKPEGSKLTSIYSVIGWCETFLSQGQTTYYINGHDGADEEVIVESKFGEWMKLHPIHLP